MPPELIIFDCDGVLIDSEAIACRADSACLAEIGIALSAEEIMDRYLGISAAAMCADIERRQGCVLPAGFAATLRVRVAAAFEAELAPMAGVEAALAALPYPRCVASSSAPERLRHSLSLTRLLHWFEPHVFSAAQVARGKPAPDLFLYAAQRFATAPEHCLVIEDSPAGIDAAVTAGMTAIGFCGGSHCGPEHGNRLQARGAALVV
jgi:HAD superfamily hydrolase (TIGR01509 family)